MKSASAFIMRCLRSPNFFFAIVGLLILQAAWVALSARYPQAFDENYHLGLIQLHAQQLLPFFTHQPSGDAVYGALARDPSYLYHYLFSFPYLLISHFTDSLAVQVIVLRFLNIAIFVGGLVVYRKLLAELGISRAVSHVVLLFFVVTPVVALLAAQINYDNLMFLLTGLLFLLTVRYYEALQESATKLPVILGLQFLAVGAFGSLVKFPFAPIFGAAAVILAFLTWHTFRHNRPLLPKFDTGRSKLTLALYGLIAGAALLLCFERYGLNLVQYHAPVPKCHKVLSVDACQAYSPWARDYMFAATYPRPTLLGIVVYPGVWAHRMVFESMFTITSTYWEDRTPNRTIVYYYVAPPMPVANYTAWTVLVFGVVAIAWYWRCIWQQKALRLLLIVVGFYTLVLFVQNFAMYIHTGEAVAIHGRYLIPVFPLLFLPLVQALAWVATRLKLVRYRALILVVVTVLFMQGAGLITWIVRSESWWYWPQSRAAERANWLAKDVLYKIILR